MNSITKKALTGLVFMLIFAVAIGTAFAQVPPTLQKTPYLIYPGNNTQMEVLWQDYDLETTNYVTWYSDPAMTNQVGTQGNLTEINVGSNGHQYAYTITGLQPDTMYYYQVGDTTNGAVYGTGSFMTAPATGLTHVKFLAQGDSRNQTSGLDALMHAMSWFYQQPGNAEYQRLSIHNGDWVSTDGEQYWTAQWFADLPNIMNYTANVPINGCKGNHDNTSGYSATFPKYFPYPYPTSQGAMTAKTGTGALDGNNNPYYNNLFWSFDYGPVHFTIIDEYTTPFGPGSAQYTWIVNDLAAASANPNTPWKIVIYHEPAYSAGSDSDNTTIRVLEGAGGATNLIAQYGVDLIYCGHSHNYARTGAYNLNQAGGDPIALNVPHITSGGGGAPIYQPDMTNAKSYPHVITAWPSFEFMTFDVEGKTLTMTAYQVNNITNLAGCTQPPAGGPWVPSCSTYAIPGVSVTPIETVVLNHFTNVTPQISYSASGFVYNRAAKTWTTNLTITNNGPNDLTGNVDVVLDGILYLQNINTNVVTGAVTGTTPSQLTNMYSTASPKLTSMIAKNGATGSTSPAGSGLLTTVTLTNATGSNNGEPLIQVSTTGFPNGQSLVIPLTFTTSAPQNGNPAFSGVSFNPVIYQE
jgi:hypothetical protein